MDNEHTPLQCDKGPELREIKGDVKELHTDFKVFVEKLSDVLINDREWKVRLDMLDTQMKTIYNKVDTIKHDVRILNSWKDKIVGGAFAYRYLPTIVAIGALIFAYVK